MPRLDYYANEELEATVPLETPEVTLGSDAICTVTLPDPEVSRLHAVIAGGKDGHTIENRGASGTRVNGEAVAAPRRLSPGDAISIARYVLVYQADDAPVRERGSSQRRE